MKPISDEEIKRAYMGSEYHLSFKLTLEMEHSLERVVQAQLESDKEKMREIFEEIERHFGADYSPKAWWQALKKECLGGE